MSLTVKNAKMLTNVLETTIAMFMQRAVILLEDITANAILDSQEMVSRATGTETHVCHVIKTQIAK